MANKAKDAHDQHDNPDTHPEHRAPGATSTISTSQRLQAVLRRLSDLRMGRDNTVAAPGARDRDRFEGAPLLSNDDLAAMQAAVVELRATEDPMAATGVTELDPVDPNAPPPAPHQPAPHREA